MKSYASWFYDWKKILNVRKDLTPRRSLWPTAYKNDRPKHFSIGRLVQQVDIIYFEGCMWVSSKICDWHFNGNKLSNTNYLC